MIRVLVSVDGITREHQFEEPEEARDLLLSSGWKRTRAILGDGTELTGLQLQRLISPVRGKTIRLRDGSDLKI